MFKVYHIRCPGRNPPRPTFVASQSHVCRIAVSSVSHECAIAGSQPSRRRAIHPGPPRDTRRERSLSDTIKKQNPATST